MHFNLGTAEVQKATEELIEPTHTEPTRPLDKIDVFEMMIMWKNDYCKHKEATKKASWAANKTHAFALVLVFCATDLKGRLEGNEDHDAIKTNQGVIKLLILIRKIYFGKDETKHSDMALVESNMDLYTTR